MKLLVTALIALTFVCSAPLHADYWNPFNSFGYNSNNWWYPKKKKTKSNKKKAAKQNVAKRPSQKRKTVIVTKKTKKRSNVQAVAPTKKSIPLPVRKGAETKRRAQKSNTPKSQRGQVKRPPQYVMLAFDGSKSHSMWAQSVRFAEENNIKFTYFISGVYFLSNKDKRRYREPKRGAGRSAIGWGGTDNDVAQRVQHVLRAYRKGHEIASHANGHYNGAKYSYNQWLSELNQFDSILNRSWGYTDIQKPKSWLAMINDVIGVRAPLLGYGKGLFSALKTKKYRYDTSRARGMNYWPKKIKGVWDYPLAGLKIWGTNKRTLSMDYNFYVADSKGKRGNSANYKMYENRMLKTYLAYFKKNYFGNRAPIDIGHHFSMWNGGAYWKAMKRFAKAVCGLPEVICGTYTELTEFLEDTSSSTRHAYQYARFPKMRRQDVQMPAILSRISNDNFQFTELTEDELKSLEHQHHQDHWKAHKDDGNPHVHEWAPGTYEI